MNVIWRFLWVILFSRFSSKVSLFDECTSSYRVLPTDIDVLMHMNNGRYFSLMDLARIDFMIRCGVFSVLKKNKIYPVVASEMMRFRRSLSLFQRYSITSKLVGWDEKYFYLAQYFIVGHKVHAFALVKARFLRSTSGPIDPSEILHLMNMNASSPPLPSWVSDWQQADQAFYDKAVVKRER